MKSSVVHIPFPRMLVHTCAITTLLLTTLGTILKHIVEKTSSHQICDDDNSGNLCMHRYHNCRLWCMYVYIMCVYYIARWLGYTNTGHEWSVRQRGIPLYYDRVVQTPRLQTWMSKRIQTWQEGGHSVHKSCLRGSVK